MASTCSLCKYFSPQNDKIGLCTRYPPHPFPVGRPGQSISIWPSVQTHQTCGEWAMNIVEAKDLPQ